MRTNHIINKINLYLKIQVNSYWLPIVEKIEKIAIDTGHSIFWMTNSNNSGGGTRKAIMMLFDKLSSLLDPDWLQIYQRKGLHAYLPLFERHHILAHNIHLWDKINRIY